MMEIVLVDRNGIEVKTVDRKFQTEWTKLVCLEGQQQDGAFDAKMFIRRKTMTVLSTMSRWRQARV